MGYVCDRPGVGPIKCEKASSNFLHQANRISRNADALGFDSASLFNVVSSAETVVR